MAPWIGLYVHEPSLNWPRLGSQLGHVKQSLKAGLADNLLALHNFQIKITITLTS